MPIDYSIDIELGLLRTFWSGDIGDSEFVARYREIFDDSDFAYATMELTDLSKLASFSLTAGAMKTIVDATSNRMGDAVLKTSVYAPSSLAFGTARMYFAYADNKGSEVVNVFRTLQEAEAWLGLPDPGR